jgi:hypothetical protein
MIARVPDAISAFTRVFYALWQRERAPMKPDDMHSPDGAREWCTADPGPPKNDSLAVPGLQRTAILLSCSIDRHWPRYAAPGTRTW